MTQNEPIVSRFLTISQTCKRVPTSRSNVYRRIQAGDFQAVKRGRTTLIDRASIEQWMDNLPRLKLNANP